jgi:hypothetical protein
MTRILLIFSLLLVLAACKNHTGAGKASVDENTTGPYMYFNEVAKDYGKIKQGDTLFCNFIVENRGKTDLLIKRVVPGCGCTGAKYEQKPIPPKGSGKITLIFATNDRKGRVSKSATVFANTKPETQELRFSCEVVTK